VLRKGELVSLARRPICDGANRLAQMAERGQAVGHTRASWQVQAGIAESIESASK